MKRPDELDDADRHEVDARGRYTSGKWTHYDSALWSLWSGLHIDARGADGSWVEVPMQAVADLLVLRPEMIGVVQRVNCGEAGIKEFRIRHDLTVNIEPFDLSDPD